ncbi:MAG: hypothetical protein RRY19_04250 [Clostridium sp.]
MIIRNFRKKFITSSIALIIIGLIIILFGFGLSGFNLKVFKEDNTPKWYKTFYVDDNWFSIGFKFLEK